MAASTGSIHDGATPVGGRGRRVERAVVGAAASSKRALSSSRRRWLKPVPTPPANASAVAVPASDEQRPERVRAVAVAGGVAADDDLGRAGGSSPCASPWTGRPVGSVEPSRLAITPSSSWASVASSSAWPSPMRCAGISQLGPSSTSSREQPAALLVRQGDRVVAIDGQHVEHEAARPPGRSDSLRWISSKRGRPSSSSTTSSPSRIARCAAELGGERLQLGVARRDVVQVRALQPDLAVVDERDRPVAVPLDLVRPAVVLGGQRARSSPSSGGPGTTAPTAADPGSHRR